MNPGKHDDNVQVDAARAMVHVESSKAVEGLIQQHGQLLEAQEESCINIHS